MTFTITPLLPEDISNLETMLDRAFGLDRHTKTSYRLREGNSAVPGLSLAARKVEGCLVGAISFWPVCIGKKGFPALLLGPLVVHWERQGQGIGLALMQEGLKRAQAAGHELVILVGDAPYYERVGFKILPEGRLLLPGPVDPKRFLYLDLQPGGLEQAQGLVLSPQRYGGI